VGFIGIRINSGRHGRLENRGQKTAVRSAVRQGKGVDEES
jgi:hypothetical protein